MVLHPGGKWHLVVCQSPTHTLQMEPLGEGAEPRKDLMGAGTWVCFVWIMGWEFFFSFKLMGNAFRVFSSTSLTLQPEPVACLWCCVPLVLRSSWNWVMEKEHLRVETADLGVGFAWGLSGVECYQWGAERAMSSFNNSTLLQNCSDW